MRKAEEMAADFEVDAMAAGYGALKPLSPLARDRALVWMQQRFDWEQREGKKAAMAVSRIARKIRRLSVPHREGQ